MNLKMISATLGLVVTLIEVIDKYNRIKKIK